MPSQEFQFLMTTMIINFYANYPKGASLTQAQL